MWQIEITANVTGDNGDRRMAAKYIFPQLVRPWSGIRNLPLPLLFLTQQMVSFLFT